MSKLVGFENGDLLPSDDANNTQERERVIVVMPDDDLEDASASEEPVVLVVTGEDETTTQPNIAVPPFGPFNIGTGVNLLDKDTRFRVHPGEFVAIGKPTALASKEQHIKVLWKQYERESLPQIGVLIEGRQIEGESLVVDPNSIGGLEHLVNETGWAVDCMKWRGRVLTGLHQHYCFDWDDLPMDDTCKEWPCGCAEYESAANQVNGGINE